MIPVQFRRPQESNRPDEELPAPGSRPVDPLDPSILNELWEAEKSEQLSDSPTLRPLVEQTVRQGKTPPRPRSGREVIRQRYPDGKIQIVREVAQDGAGNYFNHGRWQLFNRQGQILAEGTFEEGLMQGYWSRWHPSSAGGVFSTSPYNQFPGPYFSTATFEKGQLNGLWTLFDRHHRKIFEIPYRDGKRNGTATWWYPNGTRMRQVGYADNLIDGSLKEWNSQSRLTRHDEFISGRKIIRETSMYVSREKKETENYFLDSRLELNGQDDWWSARPADYLPAGERTRHGPALAWHDSGQLKMKGQYVDGQRTGPFTWWHSNGQKQLEGTYREGLKMGVWTWWHPNGQRAVQGAYEADQPAGPWTWWNDVGEIVSDIDYDEQGESLIEIAPSVETDGGREAEPVELLPFLEDRNDSIETLPSPQKGEGDSDRASRPAVGGDGSDDSLPRLDGPQSTPPGEITIPADSPLPPPPAQRPDRDRITRHGTQRRSSQVVRTFRRGR